MTNLFYCGRVRARALTGGSLIAMAVGLSGTALAQSTPPAQPAAPQAAPAAPDTSTPTTQPPSPIEQVVVTGTRIRGVAPVGSTIISVGQEEIQNSGLASTAQILYDVPQVLSIGTGDSYIGGSPQEQNNLNSVAFENSANLRGLGPQATLNLVDGHRMPYEGANMNSFDGNDIPTQLLQRVEIVADGTSPIYGADAIAGTVNYLMRQPADVIESYGEYNTADGTSGWQGTQIFGRTWDTGGFIIGYQHAHSDTLQASSRSNLYNDDYAPFGGPPSSDFADPGNVVVNGVDYAIPKGQNGQDLTLAQLGPAGSTNRQNVWDGTTVIPESNRDSLAGNFKQSITNWLEFFGDFLWTDRDYNIDLPATDYDATLTVPNSNYWSPCNHSLAGAPKALIAACATGSLTVNYNLLNALGPEERDGYFRTLEGSSGFHISLPYEWTATLQYTGGLHKESDITDNYFGDNATELDTQLAGTTASTAFNPFCDGMQFTCNPRSLTKLDEGAPFLTAIMYSLNDYTADANGPLFELPGGDVRMALGTEYNRGVFTNVNSEGETKESRHIISGYSELYIPIVGPGNALPFVQNLELDLAGRIDSYSDVGETKNPKIGINWTPVDDFKIHGSFGTSFRAPGLADNDPFSQHIWIGAGPYPGNSVNANLCPSCSANPGLWFFQDVGGADGTVKPETSRSYSVGGDWTPAQVDGLDLGVNYWQIKYSGEINTPAYNVGPYQAVNEQYFNSEIIYNPMYFPSLYKNNPVAFFGNYPTVNLSNPNCSAVFGKHVNTQALYNSMVACIETGGDFGLAGPPVPASAVAALEDGHRMNSGETDANGLDFNAHYSWDDAWGVGGKWRVGGIAELVTNYQFAPVPTAPLVNEVNHFGYPLQFKGRAEFGYDRDLPLGDMSATVYLNYANSYMIDDDLLPAGVSSGYTNINSYTTVDLTLIYRTEDAPDDYMEKNLTFSFSVQNLFDQTPPLVLNSGSLGGIMFDPSNANPIGRNFMFQISKSW